MGEKVAEALENLSVEGNKSKVEVLKDKLGEFKKQLEKQIADYEKAPTNSDPPTDSDPTNSDPTVDSKDPRKRKGRKKTQAEVNVKTLEVKSEDLDKISNQEVKAKVKDPIRNRIWNNQ